MNKKTIMILVLVSLSMMFFSSTSFASKESRQSDWEFNLAPFYLWGISIDGDLTAGPVTAPVNVPFEDVFDSLEAAFIFHFETLYKTRWGFLVDFNYMNHAALFGCLAEEVETRFDAPVAEFVDLAARCDSFEALARHLLDQETGDLVVGGLGHEHDKR